MTPEGQIWIYIFLHYVKRFIETVLCIWVANYGMICLSSYKILLILNHLNIITECINVSLAHDRIDISQFLYEVMIISLLHESSTLYMDMNFCILSGMGWSSILCYIYVTTLHDSYLYIESYPYVLLLSIAKWFYSLISSDYLLSYLHMP